MAMRKGKKVSDGGVSINGLSQADTMKRLAISLPTCIKWRKEGRLVAEKRDGRWIYDEHSVAEASATGVGFEAAAVRKIEQLLSDALVGFADQDDGIHRQASVIEALPGSDSRGSRELSDAIAKIVRLLKDTFILIGDRLAAAKAHLEWAGPRMKEPEKRRLEAKLSLVVRMHNQKMQKFDEALEAILSSRREEKDLPATYWRQLAALPPADPAPRAGTSKAPRRRA